MKKLIMWNVITIDGFFEGQNPWDLKFHDLVWGFELENLSIEQLNTADALIFGANTYRGMASYWSKEKGKIANRMNQIKKYVCTTTLTNTEWNNTTIIRDAISEIKLLKENGEGTLFVFGSAILSETLTKSRLFDEYRLCISPILLGKGKRLFNDIHPSQILSLLEVKKLSTGGIYIRYKQNN